MCRITRKKSVSISFSNVFNFKSAIKALNKAILPNS